MKKKFREIRLHWIYGLNFLFFLSMALLSYVMSSFLKQYVDIAFVGTVFTVAYLLSFFALGDIKYFITLLNPRRSLRVLILISLVCLLGMTFIQEMWTVLTLFVVYMMTINLLLVNMDVIIEHYSKTEDTGRIRGLILTFGNFAFVFAPVVAGILLDRFNFTVLFVLAAVVMIPIYLSFRFNFKDIAYSYKKRKKKQLSDEHSILKLKKEPSIQLICWISVALHVFYSIMVVYVPLHLLSLGYGWTEIGIMLTIGLVPFVLIQYMAGWLADKYWGEQEMLITGFLVIGIATMALFFVTSFFAWVIFLFITRIGAALLEILSESYFYKQVDEDDVALISLFRRSNPLGYAIGPLLASIVLQFYGMSYVFLFLGFSLILGVFLPYFLKDTR